MVIERSKAMIRGITAYRNAYGVRYKVLYSRTERTYTNGNLPKAAKEFIQTHPYEKQGESRMVFR